MKNVFTFVNQSITKKNEIMENQIASQQIALNNALKNAYKIKETKSTYIFSNKLDMWVELRKTDGSYVNGNFYDNEITQILFRSLYKMAKSI